MIPVLMKYFVYLTFVQFNLTKKKTQQLLFVKRERERERVGEEERKKITNKYELKYIIFIKFIAKFFLVQKFIAF